MNAVLILIIAIVGLGLIFQKYDKRTRWLVLLVAAAMVVYVTIR